jgi:glycosyltransferase involved in cell wall biosynthesis
MSTSTTVSAAEPGPLVSIGVPVYNEEQHLQTALDSLLAQDHQNIEIIICDNASTDATADIIAGYASRDPRVQYHRNASNIGGIANFNKAFQLARGEFFMWASGHDVRHPAQISTCLKVLLEDPGLVLCYSQVCWVDQSGHVTEEIHEFVDTRAINDRLARLNIVLWSLRGGFPIYGVFRTAALRQTPVYTQVFSPDMSLLIELALLGRFAYVPEPRFHLRRAIDQGNWETYVAKHFAGGEDRRAATQLYWRMVWQLCGRVSKHMRTLPGKALASFFILPAMFINYRWMLAGLRSLKKPNKQQLADQKRIQEKGAPNG